MKIRTQLIVAFLLLSVVPLTGIVLYSWYSSQQAVRAAMQREAEEMAVEMDQRVGAVRREVGERIARLGNLPFRDLAAGGDGDAGDPLAGKILAEMGDAAPFVEAIEFVPVAAPDPVEPVEPVAEDAGSGTTSPVSQVAVTAPVAPVPPVATVETPVVVINIDEILQNARASLAEAEVELTEEQAQQIARSAQAAREATEALESSRADSMREYQRAMQRYEAQVERWADSFDAKGRPTGPAPVPPPPPPHLTSQFLSAARLRAESRQRAATVIPEPPPGPAAAPAPAGPAVRETPAARVEARHAAAAERDRSRILFGRELQLPVKREGEVVGRIRPRIRAGLLIESLLGVSERQEGEIPFAVDNEGNLYTMDEPSKETLASLGIDGRKTQPGSRRILENWVIATSKDEDAGLTLGIARPIREPLEDVRRAAGRNFAYGLGLIGIALIGIIPIANHMTRDVELVTEGAERIAQGDLETEVPIRSTNEFGSLAVAFNRMARDLRDHQTRLVEEARLRKEQELQQRLLEKDFERKSDELEQARHFQLSLLPKRLPRVQGAELGVYMRTATEVGGDYYDFHVGPGGSPLTIAIGDATGHGAAAGTMVTIIKSLFTTYRADRSPGAFLRDAGETIRKMELGRMTMGLLLARLEGRTLTLAAAAMPPVFLYRRRTRAVEELAPIGFPLGSFESGYRDLEVELEEGDTLLFMSDGFPELPDHRGDPLGYVAAENAFRIVGGSSPDEIISALSRAAEERTGGAPPADDITFVVVRIGARG